MKTFFIVILVALLFILGALLGPVGWFDGTTF